MNRSAGDRIGNPMPGRKAVIMAGAIALVTSAIFLFTITDLLRQHRVATESVDRALEVLNVVTRLDADLATVVGEARGFIIDENSDSRLRFEASTSQVYGDIANLRILTADDPLEQATLTRIQPVIAARVGLARDIIDALDAGDVVGSVRIFSSRLAGEALAAQITVAVADLKAEEKRVLADRRATAQHIAGLWLTVSVACGIVAAASWLVAVALLLVRGRKSQRLAELLRLNAGLEESVGAHNVALIASEKSSRLLAEDLLVSETRYRLLAENTNDLIICTGLDLKRTYASPACRVMLGYEPEEMVHDESTGAVHPDDADVVGEALQPLTVGAIERQLITYRARHKAGNWIWVEATISVVRDRITGDPSSLVCSLRDISERHAQAEALHDSNARLEHLARHLVSARDKAERASRAKSRFLAGMSHELRTPLNGILGYAQLLRMEGGLNASQSTRVNAMLEAGRHLLEMIQCVLDLSEIEVERFVLQPTDFELHRLAAACVDLVRPTAEAKPLSLRLSIAADVPLHVRTDPTRLRQVLLNLLGNAVKFTARGSVELRLLALADDTQLRFEVIDTGRGILPEQRRHLFQDFERLDTNATRAGPGAGLGLSISAQLAALMGGRVGHDDNPVGGSVFWLELPLVTTTAPATMSLVAATPAADAQAAEPSLAPARVLNVLVVDDIAMNRDIASSFLRVAGHDVICAEGGAEAVATVATVDFDVVLMDVRMPEMDGLQATREIRAMEGERGRVPIVAVTAQAFADQVADCREAGMDSHLAKPFDPDSLLAAVVLATTTGHVPSAAVNNNAVVVPPVISASDPELLVFDSQAFDRTAAFLAPDAVSSYLRDIAKRGDVLLQALRGSDALGGYRTELADAAHTLAGSAGMFGFERLASVGRHFERAVQTGAKDAPALAAALSHALEATLQVIEDRASITLAAWANGVQVG